MNTIKIEYTVGSDDVQGVEVGTYTFNSNDASESFITNVLNKTIKGIKSNKSVFVTGLCTVFVNRVRKFEVVFMGDPAKDIKPKIYKV